MPGPTDQHDAQPLPSQFSAATRAWFAETFPEPTAAQSAAWESIVAGRHSLVVAPTGSGKTLAAFLWALDRLASAPTPAEVKRRCRVLYVSPLKALAVDVERNLRAPLAGIRRCAERDGQTIPEVSIAIRTGDTPANERATFARRPADILITTPESLYLILTSQARDALRGVETVIVDEVHAIAGSKRGAHLALSLERLDALLDKPAQRIGLSATVRPPERVAAFLAGSAPVEVVAAPSDKRLEISVVVPVPDLGEIAAHATDGLGLEALKNGVLDDPMQRSIWPHVEERIVDLVEAHQSTIVFVNSRRIAERLTARINEIAHERVTGERLEKGAPASQLSGQSGTSGGADPVLAMAHHGSVSKERRLIVEDELKSGRLRAVVATSSLELGVDMGAVDLVVQVESPPSVASGMQRVGRAGHQVGAASEGVVFPKFRGDLVQTAVVSERMKAGLIEEIEVPRSPLDVLAQQIVAIVALEDWQSDALFTLVAQAMPYRELTRTLFDSVLDMLSGRYPSDDFAELRPRVVWDRANDSLSARPGAQRLAVTNGGTIPDRGMFGVNLVGEKGARVGELDEEMVYESRAGDVISLGSTSWRIEEITADRVLVVPSPGVPGRLPFWKGDALGRPVELGRAVGSFVHDIAHADEEVARKRCSDAGLDDWASDNLLAYLREQREATGQLPDDRTIVVEKFRDELGDWRVVVHSVFGAPVNAPWALLIARSLRERYGIDVSAMHADDGIVLRLPDLDDDFEVAPTLVFEADEVEPLVTAEAGGSAVFASRFRECAARALLLPRRHPGRRSPLWQQRRRSQQLLQVAADFGSFPVVLETMREVLQDVYDVPALTSLMNDIATRRVRVIEVTSEQPSPFARSLVFGYVAAFMYEGDAPLAERRAAALTLDAGLLGELLGQTELNELLDADAIDEVERELQMLTPSRAPRDSEDVADMLRILGPLSEDELRDRHAQLDWIASLERDRRIVTVPVAGAARWVAVEDVARLRDALGVAIPPGTPAALLEPVADPLGDLVSRYARTHGPFTTEDVAQRFGLGGAVVDGALRALEARGRLARGLMRPGLSVEQMCDVEVLRSLRRKSIAALRHEAEPVPAAAFGRFLPSWQGVGSDMRGVAGVARVVEQLAGFAAPASAWESLILPARVEDYTPAMLDELIATGEVAWFGRGSLAGEDGWVALAPSSVMGALIQRDIVDADLSATARELLELLTGGAALFVRDIAARLNEVAGDDVQRALWELVWAGRISNDTFAPLRTLGGTRRRPRTALAGGTAGRRRYASARRTVRSPAESQALAAGRWWRLPEPLDITERTVESLDAMLDRYGVLTRGSVAAEGLAGGFAGAYRVLSAMEERGAVSRAYAVEGLGGAQFAVPGAVDRLRADSTAARRQRVTVLLAATDPANPYGAALPWPPAREDHGGHRPGRKAGGLVVLVDGELVLYVERGGRSLLTWSDDHECLTEAVRALAATVRRGALATITVERADGTYVLDTPLGVALADAGFAATPRGLRLRRQ